MAKRKKKEQPQGEQSTAQAAAGTTVETVSVTAADSEPMHATTVPASDAASAPSSPNAANDDRGPANADFNTPRPVAHNNLAGVELRKFEKFKQMQLHFRNPIPDEIQGMLNGNGWTYRPQEEVYTKQFGDHGAGAAYVQARRFYQDICDKLTPQQGQGIRF